MKIIHEVTLLIETDGEGLSSIKIKGIKEIFLPTVEEEEDDDND